MISHILIGLVAASLVGVVAEFYDQYVKRGRTFGESVAETSKLALGFMWILTLITAFLIFWDFAINYIFY